MTKLDYYTKQYISRDTSAPYAIAAGAVVYRSAGNEYEFLLLGRRGLDDSITYHLPKGTVHIDETIESAAIREVAEEAGAIVALRAYIGGTTQQFTHDNHYYDKTVHYYAAEYCGEAGGMDSEHDLREWHDAQEAIELLKLEPKQEELFALRASEYLKSQPETPLEEKQDILVYYTDGSCEPNPGTGGFAVIKDMKPVVLGGEHNTTNIRMEGKAIIAALKDAGDKHAEIYTDSEFWINVITKWSIPWEANGWKKKGGEIKNLDIVQEVVPLYRTSNSTLVWVRGHNNDPGNELADEWANKAREQQLAKTS